MTCYAHSGCSCLVIFARAKSSQSETLGRYVITIEFSGLVLRVLYFLCCMMDTMSCIFLQLLSHTSTGTNVQFYLLIIQTWKSSRGKSAGRYFLKPFISHSRKLFSKFPYKNFCHCCIWYHWPTKFLIVFLQIMHPAMTVFSSPRLLQCSAWWWNRTENCIRHYQWSSSARNLQFGD